MYMCDISFTCLLNIISFNHFVYDFRLQVQCSQLMKGWSKKSMSWLPIVSTVLQRWKGTCTAMLSTSFSRGGQVQTLPTEDSIPHTVISGITCTWQQCNTANPKLIKNIYNLRLMSVAKRVP